MFLIEIGSEYWGNLAWEIVAQVNGWVLGVGMLGRRIVEYRPNPVVIVPESSVASLAAGSESLESGSPPLDYTDLYYSKDWQVIEETYRAASTDTAGLVTAGATVTQYVWGGAYVNDLVSRDVITAASTAESGKSIGWSANAERLLDPTGGVPIG